MGLISRVSSRTYSFRYAASSNLPGSLHKTLTKDTQIMASGDAKIGQDAPNFKSMAVINGMHEEFELSNWKGKYIVLFFYPLDFTFVCPTEIIAFSERVEEFRKIGCEVVAASVDSHFSHLAWTQTPRKEGGLGEMKIPLLADLTKQISKDYGVLLEDQGISLRGLFIINPQGIVRQITMNDLPVGRDVDETLRLVQAFQFTDKNGEVCPAGWKPGSATIIPNPQDKIMYFKNKENKRARSESGETGATLK